MPLWRCFLPSQALLFPLARYLMTLLEQDDCGSDEGELTHSATPSIFTEACNNETYVEVGTASGLGLAVGALAWHVMLVFHSSIPLPPWPELLRPSFCLVWCQAGICGICCCHVCQGVMRSWGSWSMVLRNLQADPLMESCPCRAAGAW